MSTLSSIHQSISRSTKQAAPWIARAAGVVTVMVGVRTFWIGISYKFLQSFIGSVLLVTLGSGVLFLRRTALKLATILLVGIAILVPFGFLNLFAEMDAPPPHLYTPGFES